MGFIELRLCLLVPVQGGHASGGASGQQGVVQRSRRHGQIRRGANISAQLMGLGRNLQGIQFSEVKSDSFCQWFSTYLSVLFLFFPEQVGFRHYKDYQVYVWAKGEQATQVCPQL